MTTTSQQDILESVIQAAPYGMIAYDLEGKILVANKNAIDQLGLALKARDLIGLEILAVVENLDALKTLIKKCLRQNRKKINLEGVYHNNRYLNFRGRHIIDGMILTIADITYLKESETRSLNTMLEAQELERKRLAAEIHDGIGPILSTVKLNLAAIESTLESTDKELGVKFRQSYQMIDEAADDLRSISHNLMPRILSDFGLIEALTALCEKVDTTKKISVVFIQTNMENRFNQIVELGLYRICQELINNTLKHAGANKITLQLIHKGDHILLMYEDDGKGFDLMELKPGLGLLNIENRAKALAGEMHIDSQPNKGMTATIEAYLKPTS